MTAVPGDLLYVNGATDIDIKEVVKSFFLALYKQRGLAFLNTAIYEIY